MGQFTRHRPNPRVDANLARYRRGTECQGPTQRVQQAASPLPLRRERIDRSASTFLNGPSSRTSWNNMTNESAFWQALAANPDDEAVRLAFADWLEQKGDPRSAWIRNPAMVHAMEEPWADPTANLVKRLGEAY